jgi:hypothetical protein
LAAGGNGHSFKNLVNVGKYVVQAMEGALDCDIKNLTDWRPSRARKEITDNMYYDIDKATLIKDGSI